mmetsp:Transcript_11570/g.17603  ORF Transcript_11570/g.17603 Transcript_11570/m.17603 type:complete len:231 (+) Transcript_11570:12-704(+)
MIITYYLLLQILLSLPLHSEGMSIKTSRWIHRFCQSAGNEVLVEVPYTYLKDVMVISWLNEYKRVKYFPEALSVIADDSYILAKVDRESMHKIDDTTKRLYSLLHSRYVVTNQGLTAIMNKYSNGVYGVCPRVYCNGSKLLPVGLHDQIGMSSMKYFCPKCRDVYHPQSSFHKRIDGAAFGTTLPHLLLQKYPELCSEQPQEKYVPRIFGFRLHRDSEEMKIHRGDNSLD